jgi:hypothetical protein
MDGGTIISSRCGVPFPKADLSKGFFVEWL